MKVCVGIVPYEGYIVVDPYTNQAACVAQKSDLVFNDSKFNKLKKTSKRVYTILAEIIPYEDSKEILGYLISDDLGAIGIETFDAVISVLNKNACMNYSVAQKGSKKYLRKNPNIEVPLMTNEKIKEIYGFDMGSFNLRKDMSPKELAFCMRKNGFELGYSNLFKAKQYGDELKQGEHRVYYNKDGTLMVFNLLEGANLNWFGQSMIYMRHINSDKYLSYLKNNSYMMGSSNPIDGPNTDITVFTQADVYKFMRINRSLSSYSKPCKPYYLSPKGDGVFEMMLIDPKQYKWLQRNDTKYSLLARIYIGFKNLENYSPGLKEFYKEYIKNKEAILKNKLSRYKIDEEKFLQEKKEIDLAFKNGEL